MAGRGGTVMSGAAPGLALSREGALELGRNAGVETMKVNVAPVTVVVTAWAG